MARYDFSAMADEIAAEVHRQGERCLEGTLQLALAADQRAATLCGVFLGVAVAVAAAVAAGLAGQGAPGGLLAGGTTAAAFMFAAALAAAWAGRPVDFFVGGYEPQRLMGAGRDPAWLFKFMAEDVQRRIDGNRRALERAAMQLRVGVVLALLAPVMGGAAVLAFRYSPGRFPF